MLRSKRGFTLVEVLLVILVIGILVGILGIRAGSVSTEAKKKAVMADLKTLKKAVQVYHMQYGRYPADNPNTYLSQEILNDADKRLVDEIPQDVFETREYGYDTDNETSPQSAKYYVIYSVGPNGSGSCNVNTPDTVTSTDEDNLWVSNCRTNNHGGI